MPIARMMVCEWLGVRVNKHTVPTPSLEQVEAAVRRLDNHRFNDLYLEPGQDEAIWLCVGGGAGRYLLSGAVSHQRFPTLLDPARPVEPAEPLVVGGQEGTYPGNQIHDLDTALRVVRAFWSTGRFEDSVLLWVDV